MATTQIPPVPPAPLPTQKSAPLSPAAAIVKAAPVRQSPERPQEENERRHLEGRVKSNDRDRREVRIETAQGEVTVEADTDLPADSDVTLDLYLEKKAVLANIRLKQVQEDMAQLQANLRMPATAAKQLAAGDTVTALVLPDDAAAPPAQGSRDAALRQVANMLQQAQLAGLNKIPATLRLMLPAIPPALDSVLGAKDVFAALNNLSDVEQQDIKNFMAQPAVANALKAFLANAQMPPQGTLQQALSAYTNPHFNDAPAAAGADVADNNLLQIVKAQLSAKLTYNALQAPGDTTGGAPLAALKGLLPSIDNMQSLRGIMPPDVMTHLQEVDNALARKFTQLNIIDVIPPGGKLPPLQPGQSMGVIETATESGAPLMKTDSGHLVFRSAFTVAQGSTIIFQSSAMTLEQVLLQQSGGAEKLKVGTGFEPLASRTWPALDEALQTLNQTAPQAAALMRETLPAPSARLVPTALFFLAALRAGNVESWLGGNVLQALRDSGKKDSTDKLSGDFGKLSSQSKETINGEWRAISMPLLHDDRLGQLQFFVRRQHDDENKGEDDGTPKPVTRFILNLNLSRMGDMQLDGLLRQKRFDMVLRSMDHLPMSMRQELMQAFARGVEQAGMQGAISFQKKSDHWVSIDLPAHKGTVA